MMMMTQELQLRHQNLVWGVRVCLCSTKPELLKDLLTSANTAGGQCLQASTAT
jgi:hypothetical protein